MRRAATQGPKRTGASRIGRLFYFVMKKDFRKAIAEEVLLADGAIGTLLTSRGALPGQARSPLNLSDPASVREVHDDYLDAGARILTTNTWDANRVKLTAHEWADSLERINREGVRLAREASAGELVFVAGSMGPLGALVKPYGALQLSQVREIFEEQARLLLESGVDLILLETFGSLLEAAEAVRAVRGLSPEIPIVAQMTFLADGRTAFGEDAPHALATLVRAGADAVGMNCTLGPQETHDVFTKLPESLHVPLSVMPNAGYPSVVHGRNVYLSSPDYLREYAAAFVEAGAAIVGGCCGTTPEHIRAMARAVAGKKRARGSRPVSIAVEAVRDVEHLSEAPIETSRLKRKLAAADDFVITAEVEPPRGADCSSAVEGARLLKASGVDAVNVTDNPMARLRMSSIAVAALIQREVGLDAVVQITTRDRNVLGLQSDLLGAAGLGVKAILCLGGDPLKIGDYPQAQAGLGGRRARAAADREGPELRGRPRRERDRRADAVRDRLRRQSRGRGSGSRDVQAARQDRGRRELRPDPARVRPRRARPLPGAAGDARDPDPGRPHPAAVAQADPLLRQRGPGNRRPAGDPGPHAPGRREGRRARERRGARDRAGAGGRDRQARPGAAHHAHGQVQDRPARSSRPSRAASERASAPRLGWNPRARRPFSHPRRRPIESAPRGVGDAKWPAHGGKRMKRTILAAAVLTALASVATPSGGVPGPDQRASSPTRQGKPIEGVTVTITTPSLTNFKLTFKTDQDGKYGTIVNDATIPYHVKIEKEGYVPVRGRREDRDRGQRRSFRPSWFPLGRRGRNRRAAAGRGAVDQRAGDRRTTAASTRSTRATRPAAEKQFLEAVTKNPDLPNAWQALTQLAYEKKDWAKTLEYGRKATDLDPGMSNLYPMMADAAKQSGDAKAAAEWSAKHLEANPQANREDPLQQGRRAPTTRAR